MWRHTPLEQIEHSAWIAQARPVQHQQIRALLAKVQHNVTQELVYQRRDEVKQEAPQVQQVIKIEPTDSPPMKSLVSDPAEAPPNSSAVPLTP